MKNSFKRDVLVLLTVSIVIGSLLASAVSFGANSYFAKTLSSLVGDYGEFDLLIQGREETKEETAAQLQKIVNEVFPGAKLKEGPAIIGTGKTTFFIALPDEYKTKKIYEDLGRIFGSIPGGASVSIMTEPRLVVRGVPEGAKNMLIESISKMEGVRFASRDGASIGVVLTSVDKVTSVSEQIKNILKQYQVIEISFPVGSEPANPIKLGDAVAADMESQMKLPFAQNVSIDGRSSDMTYMVSTMMELKRFLSAYASQVVIKTDGKSQLLKGDMIVFKGAASNAPAAGNPPEKGNVLVEVTATRSDGTAEGRIMQGDASQLTSTEGYKLVNNVIGPYVGAASYRNPRQELGAALNETAKLTAEIPGFAKDAQAMSKIAADALDNYGGSVAALEQTLTALQAAGTTIQAATGGLASIDTTGLQNQLANSSQAMGGLINTMQVLKLLQGDVGDTINSLTQSQKNLDTLKSGLGALNNVANEARKAKGAIDSIVNGGQNTLETLKAFDANAARSSLQSIDGQLAKVQQINVPQITAQLQYMAAAMPSLKDEEINRSIKLLDNFIAGQAIPGERVQILTTSAISAEAIESIVQKQVGHKNFSLYSTAAGAIEPNARAEIYQILSEVKAILAGMTAIIVTVLLLVFDHTAVMTVIRRKRLDIRVKVSGWRKVIKNFTGLFTAPERLYGMAVGAVLLTGMFIVAQGGIPYLPWIGVPVAGALLGLLVACYTEKISPIAVEEVVAAESLGLTFDEIMREIVIPSGRPGLLQKLNRRKVKFK